VTSSVPAVRDLLFSVTPDGRLAGYTLLGTIVAFAPLVILLGSIGFQWVWRWAPKARRPRP